VPTRPPAKRIFLVQGDIYCGAEQAVVSTILGSCVSVCLWDQGLKLGGINHYVLPITQSMSEPENTRYGDVAIDYLYRMMLNLGGRRQKLQAKIYGGASVFPLGGGQATVGDRNVDLALTCMQDYRIPVVAQHTGGGVGRQISFHTGTGDVVSRELATQSTAVDTLSVALRERR
jgi:chemotaxis protein CheD